MKGIVANIFIACESGVEMTSVNDVRAVAGKGLEGDRNFDKPSDKPGRQITFIEAEAIEAVNRDCKVEFAIHESRRNIVTRGVALNHLVGKKFRIGDAEFIGVRLCEPCSHLEKLTKSGVVQAFLHRGGLRAQILNDGVIRVGDIITPDIAAE